MHQLCPRPNDPTNAKRGSYVEIKNATSRPSVLNINPEMRLAFLAESAPAKYQIQYWVGGVTSDVITATKFIFF